MPALYLGLVQHVSGERTPGRKKVKRRKGEERTASPQGRVASRAARARRRARRREERQPCPPSRREGESPSAGRRARRHRERRPRRVRHGREEPARAGGKGRLEAAPAASLVRGGESDQRLRSAGSRAMAARGGGCKPWSATAGTRRREKGARARVGKVGRHTSRGSKGEGIP